MHSFRLLKFLIVVPNPPPSTGRLLSPSYTPKSPIQVPCIHNIVLHSPSHILNADEVNPSMQCLCILLPECKRLGRSSDLPLNFLLIRRKTLFMSSLRAKVDDSAGLEVLTLHSASDFSLKLSEALLKPSRVLLTGEIGGNEVRE